MSKTWIIKKLENKNIFLSYPKRESRQIKDKYKIEIKIVSTKYQQTRDSWVKKRVQERHW